MKKLIIDTVIITIIIAVIMFTMGYFIRKLALPSPRTQVYFVENETSVSDRVFKDCDIHFLSRSKNAIFTLNNSYFKNCRTVEVKKYNEKTN